jgi:hypothetical protein
MAIIIGTATHVSFDGKTEGIISANWATNPQITRLWSLGSWNSYGTFITVTKTISVTMYAGALSAKTLTPATSCANSSARVLVSIVPGSCGTGGGGNFSSNAYLSSYSYDKSDPVGFGQESWSAQEWIAGGSNQNSAPYIIYAGVPTSVIQGITEGTSSTDGANTGITFDTGNTIIDGTQGSISAGTPGIGQANTTRNGVISAVGGGDLMNSGKIGQGSATIPHTPLYFG